MKENFFEKNQESEKTEKEIAEQKEDVKKKTPKPIIIKDKGGVTILKQEARFVVNKKGETVDVEEDTLEKK